MYLLKTEQNLHDTTYDAMALLAEPALSQPVGHSNGWRCARQFNWVNKVHRCNQLVKRFTQQGTHNNLVGDDQQ